MASGICPSSFRSYPANYLWLLLFAATLILHLSHSCAVLVVARILQGVSGSVVWIAGLALLADTFCKEEIGQSMGYVFLGISLGLLLGPLLGGIIFEKAGYNAVFIVAYVFLAVDIVMRLLTIEKRAASKWLTGGQSEADPEQSVQLTDMNAATIQNRTDNGLQRTKTRRLPSIITLIKSRRLLAALWGTVVLAILVTSLDATLTIYVQKTF
jgi:MFS family permease